MGSLGVGGRGIYVRRDIEALGRRPPSQNVIVGSQALRVGRTFKATSNLGIPDLCFCLVAEMI